MEGIKGGLICPLILVCLLLLIDCRGNYLKDSSHRGVYHRVKNGETLSSIAQAYHISIHYLANVNHITENNQPKTDSVLFIPDVTHVIDGQEVQVKNEKISRPIEIEEKTADGNAANQKKAQIFVLKGTTKEEEKAPGSLPPIMPTGTKKMRSESLNAAKHEEAEDNSAKVPAGDKTQGKYDTNSKPDTFNASKDEPQFDLKRFAWPSKGKIVSRFGIQPDGTYNNGIMIEMDHNALVKAANGGQVVYSANLKDYGETIIIKHGGNYHTVYSHLDKRLVGIDERVKKGQKIAIPGSGDKRGKPRFEFEVRYKNKARNPLFFLP
jgi:lipoprotein NlpD